MVSRIKQDYTSVVKEILEYLFECYLQDGGTKSYDLGEIIRGYGFSLTEVGTFLVEKRLILAPSFRPRSFIAAISIDGIKFAHKDWLNNHFKKVASALSHKGVIKVSIMSVLEFKLKDYQIALDIARAFEMEGHGKMEEEGSDFVRLKSHE